MLRKTLLIAAFIAISTFSEAIAQDLLIHKLPDHISEKEVKKRLSKVLPKTNYDVDIIKGKKKNKSTDNINRVADIDLQTKYTYVESKKLIQEDHSDFNCCCSIAQVNSHQILIANNDFKGEIALQIIDENGNLVMNELIQIQNNIYINLDFLDAGNYRASIVGIGFHKTISITI